MNLGTNHMLRRGLLVCITLCVSIGLWAQNNNTQSPYTRFGIGEPGKPISHAAKGMGGIALGLRDGTTVNPANPASYTAVDSMTFIFDFGVSTALSVLQEGKQSFAAMQGNLDYATMLFPITHYLAFSAGITPFSSVGYRYAITEPVTNAPESSFTRSYQGSGNINQVYAGISVRPIKAWSIGINGQFLFGTLSHERRVSFDSSIPNAYNPVFNDKLKLKGWTLTAGTQVQLPIGQENLFTVGASFMPRTAFFSKQILHHTYERSGQAPQEILSDTVAARNQFYHPDSYGLGISYQRGDNWLVGADFQYRRWANSFMDTKNEYRGNDQWLVALGSQYIPNSRDRSYAKRIRYRFGLMAENSYLSIRTPEGNYHGNYTAGATFGLGLPLVDRRSFVDIAISYQRTFPTGSIKLADNYLQLSLALRFNEGWFKKIRIE